MKNPAGHIRRPAYALFHGFWRLLDYIYPPCCIGCGRRGQRYCLECQAQMHRLDTWICERCGDPYRLGRLCPNCQTTDPSFVILRSHAEFEGACQEALHSLKYQQNFSMGEVLSLVLIQRLDEFGWPVDLVVPVPLSVGRQRERGYNQSAFLAYPVALAHGIRYSSRALQRMRETVSQVSLSADERHRNVSGAFSANPDAVAGKRVLVVDDVATTGATIGSCAEALMSAGAQAVYGLTLARAVRQN